MATNTILLLGPRDWLHRNRVARGEQAGIPTGRNGESASVRTPEAFIISQVQRSVGNMNAGLIAAKPVLERYTAIMTPDRDGGLAKLRRGLDLEHYSALIITSANSKVVFRLSSFDRVRWVAVDEKVLRQLVEMPRKNNVELKEPLPYRKMNAYERHAGITPITSPHLAAPIAATTFEDGLSEQPEGNGRF
ncbi:uncharacterized protein Z518_06552 [Rhinocladiella mackenziei CBS 650.93]|uniref:Uncharacterized protein n=1 Tax=Rhinocladiella mackenziei CBS 650.93 TaxID=1442369 RepID=A0A0D2FM37_9EURO|nr:uncharacterized protein Z518_06552 [Rhinocladiella mackenziei CBS 650.93]KIX03002.1 hypothetical protein Z518_06552 [Rhinocladiella mackenziei CBS 650.93]